ESVAEACSAAITSCQMGAAPLTPDTSRMLRPALLPTHTPTVYRTDHPTPQLSRMSLLVAVLTAAQCRVARGLSNPNVRARAPRSERMSPTIHAASGSTTCRPWAFTCPFLACGASQRPPSANARYAAVRLSRSTSALPRLRLKP